MFHTYNKGQKMFLPERARMYYNRGLFGNRFKNLSPDPPNNIPGLLYNPQAIPLQYVFFLCPRNIRI